jgi:hypothetical protein
MRRQMRRYEWAEVVGISSKSENHEQAAINEQ